MEQALPKIRTEHALPSIARTTFMIHTVVAVFVGLPLLVAPFAFGGFFGYPSAPGLEPVLRSFGAIILGFGGLTSVYGLRAHTWEQVDFVIHGEIAYLAVQTVVFALSALAGVGPGLGNWLFAFVSAVLLILFAKSFAARPK
jgi:hypothetical protein